MRNMYKLSAILFFVLLLISALGVEAQRATPKTNQQNQHYNSGKNDRYDRGQNPQNNGQSQRPNYGYDNRNGDRNDHRFENQNNGYGYHGFDRQLGHHFQGGHFYKYNYGRWARMNAPVGMNVQYMPFGTEVIYTRNGIIYRFGTIYFQRARRGGGFVVINGPRYGRGW